MSDTDIGQGADLIAIAEVAAILSVSKPAAMRLIAGAADFPKPFRFNARTVRYSKAEFIEWLHSRKEQK
ncbi:helix-turn-helix transcriptional regulator [Paraburkholderia denitrificans]|uniref:Helix-turn-helix transcriptional regulator n=1 Tax=Paraburkholderia denitrificans TaxID=694025 RepID=A0ABW0J3Q2_9BURK